jgi:hypothetical protein
MQFLEQNMDWLKERLDPLLQGEVCFRVFLCRSIE